MLVTPLPGFRNNLKWNKGWSHRHVWHVFIVLIQNVKILKEKKITLFFFFCYSENYCRYFLYSKTSFMIFINMVVNCGQTNNFSFRLSDNYFHYRFTTYFHACFTDWNQNQDVSIIKKNPYVLHYGCWSWLPESDACLLKMYHSLCTFFFLFFSLFFYVQLPPVCKIITTI